MYFTLLSKPFHVLRDRPRVRRQAFPPVAQYITRTMLLLLFECWNEARRSLYTGPTYYYFNLGRKYNEKSAHQQGAATGVSVTPSLVFFL